MSPLGYKVELSPNLVGIYDVFHVSQLQKCLLDPSHVISYKPLDIQANLTYEELSMQVLDRKEQQLRTKTIPPSEDLMAKSRSRRSLVGA